MSADYFSESSGNRDRDKHRRHFDVHMYSIYALYYIVMVVNYLEPIVTPIAGHYKQTKTQNNQIENFGDFFIRIKQEEEKTNKQRRL